MNYLIRDLNQDELPREKLFKHGVGSLSEAELLALILRSGGKGISVIDLSRELLKKFGGIVGLTKADAQLLSQTKNVGLAKASGILAVLGLAQKLNEVSPQVQPKPITTADDVFNLFKTEIANLQKEQLYLVSLDSRSKVIAKDLISIGTVNETLVSPREIFKQASLRNAVKIILVHNHPSNDPRPSTEDVEVTKLIADAGVNFGINLIDHIVMAKNSFVSLNRKGFLKGGDKYNN